MSAVRLNFMHDQEYRTDINVREIGCRLALAGIKSFLILLAAGLWCVQLHGATNGFETPPPEAGSIQWENIQRLTKERQELYRKRVPVPGAMAEDVPRAGGANFAASQKTMAAQAQPPQSSPAASGKFSEILFFGAAFVFIGVLIVQRFAPQVLVDINQRLNPWALAPAAGMDSLAKVLAEEEAFGEFLTAFRVGPSASPRTNLLEKDHSAIEFYARAKKHLLVQRKLLQDIGREASDPARQKMLTNLYF